MTPPGETLTVKCSARTLTYNGVEVVVVDRKGAIRWRVPIAELGQVVMRRGRMLELRPYARTGLQSELVPLSGADPTAVQHLTDALWAVLRTRPQAAGQSREGKLLGRLLALDVGLQLVILIPSALFGLALLVVCGMCAWTSVFR